MKCHLEQAADLWLVVCGKMNEEKKCGHFSGWTLLHGFASMAHANKEKLEKGHFSAKEIASNIPKNIVTMS